MIALLVLLFLAFYMAQLLYERKGQLTHQTSLTLPRRKNTIRPVRTLVGRVADETLQKGQPFDVRFADATRAYQQLRLHYEAGLVDKAGYEQALDNIFKQVEVRGRL